MPELPKFRLPDFSGFDLSDFDATRLSELDDKVIAALRDAAYVTIGFGVLAVQHVQVRRREVMTQLGNTQQARKQQIDELVAQAQELAELARKQVRGLIRSAA